MILIKMKKNKIFYELMGPLFADRTIIKEMDGQLYTPPVQCGLLSGTYRSLLIQQGKVEEKVLAIEDLNLCERVYLANSVRKLWPIEIEPSV